MNREFQTKAWFVWQDHCVRQLKLGIKINVQVLEQWLRHYGDDARELLKRYGYETDD